MASCNIEGTGYLERSGGDQQLTLCVWSVSEVQILLLITAVMRCCTWLCSHSERRLLYVNDFVCNAFAACSLQFIATTMVVI